MNPTIIAGLAPVVLIAAINWRLALYSVVAMAVLQDAARKLTPGEPVYFVVIVGVVFAAGYLAALLAGVRLNLKTLPGWRHYLGAPFGLLLFVLAVQAVRGYNATGSVAATGIGILTYLGPIPAVMFGYQYARCLGTNQVARFFKFYVVCTVAGACTLYLQYSGVDWSILGEVGQGVRIYDKIVGALGSFSGIYRSSEVAAWHLAATVCILLLILTWRKTSPVTTVLILVAIVGLLALGTVTGRRKMYVEVAVFMGVYLAVSLYFGRGARKMAGVVFLLGALVFGYVTYYIPSNADRSADGSSYQAYVVRSRSVAGDIGSRFEELGLGPVFWAYESTGILGAGVGTGSQGAGQFGGGINGAAEGGLGKVMTELGLPGMVAVGWFLVGLLRLLGKSCGPRLRCHLAWRVLRLRWLRFWRQMRRRSWSRHRFSPTSLSC